jgi:hypothetical protein
MGSRASSDAGVARERHLITSRITDKFATKQQKLAKRAAKAAKDRAFIIRCKLKKEE